MQFVNFTKKVFQYDQPDGEEIINLNSQINGVKGQFRKMLSNTKHAH